MILKEIDTVYRKLGQREAEKASYKWFKEAKKNINDPSVVFVENSLMQPGKINVFRYNPLHKDKLAYYDKNPVVLNIGTIYRNKQRLELGINLNFLPAPYKWYVLDAVQKLYSGFFNRVNNAGVNFKADKQPFIKYNYNVLKSILTKYGFGFAIRTYIPSRKSKLNVISYGSWVNAAFLSIEDFEKISYNQMIREFSKYKN